MSIRTLVAMTLLSGLLGLAAPCVVAAQTTPAQLQAVRAQAEKGDGVAQRYLGDAYAKGLGVPQDYAEAYKWYFLASLSMRGDKEYLEALFTVKKLMTPAQIADGEQRSVAWVDASFRKAIEGGAATPTRAPTSGGVVAAQTTPAEPQILRAQAEKRDPIVLGQVQTTPAQLQALRARAAKGDNAEAQYELGVAYAFGQGVPQDDAQAVAWFRKAADQGFAEAHLKLGVVYAEGLGVPQDDKQAVVWFRKAADQGLAAAQHDLFLAYFEGQGVPQDDKQAVVWLRKAADQGFAAAQLDLGVAYSEGGLPGVPQNDKQAVVWYRKAADQGFAAAQSELAEAYAKGWGVPKDAVEAHKWYNLAVAFEMEEKARGRY